LFRPGRLSSAGPLHPGGIARPAPASAEHEPVAATDEHELAKTKVHGSFPKDQYEGNLRLFLGNDLADQGEGISLIREQVEANLCFHCEIVGRGCSRSAASFLERAVATRQLDRLKRDFAVALVARDAPPRHRVPASANPRSRGVPTPWCDRRPGRARRARHRLAARGNYQSR
jgi:hypothetical protein